MVNFVEFILIIVLACSVAFLLILATGLTHTKKDYVSIIERFHKFYRLEKTVWTYYLPFVFSRRFMYPTKEAKCKLKDTTIIVYYCNDIMLLYKNKIHVDKLIKKSTNLDRDFAKYNIKLIRIE